MIFKRTSLKGGVGGIRLGLKQLMILCRFIFCIFLRGMGDLFANLFCHAFDIVLNMFLTFVLIIFGYNFC